MCPTSVRSAKIPCGFSAQNFISASTLTSPLSHFEQLLIGWRCLGAICAHFHCRYLLALRRRLGNERCQPCLHSSARLKRASYKLLFVKSRLIEHVSERAYELYQIRSRNNSVPASMIPKGQRGSSRNLIQGKWTLGEKARQPRGVHAPLSAAAYAPPHSPQRPKRGINLLNDSLNPL